MRFLRSTRLIEGLLVVGVVAGFGSEIHRHHHHRHGHADALARVCVDAALGRDLGVADEWGHGGHRARWVAERCAAHAREAGAR
jgi:hypothetical protein